MSQTAIPMTDDANAASIVNNSGWFPIGLSLRDGTFDFVQSDENAIAAEPFVSEASWKPAGPRRRLSIAATLANWPDTAPLTTNFIWHTGLCGSTLLSRALDRKGRNLSLREPDILSALADVKRAKMLGDPQYRRLPRAVFGLLSRPLAADSSTLIKGAPGSAAVIPEAAQLTTGKMLFLYSDLRSFIVAVARGGEPRRAFMRRMFRNIAMDGHEQNEWPVAKLFEMTDLQIAALAWHMHMAHFRRSMAMLGDRAVSLDIDVFLQSPRTTLQALDDFFALGLGSDFISETAQGPLLHRHAVKGSPVTDAWDLRLQEQRVDAGLAESLEILSQWSYRVSKTAPGVPLPNALIASEKSYQP